MTPHALCGAAIIGGTRLQLQECDLRVAPDSANRPPDVSGNPPRARQALARPSAQIAAAHRYRHAGYVRCIIGSQKQDRSSLFVKGTVAAHEG